jgi:hypothetical protein
MHYKVSPNLADKLPATHSLTGIELSGYSKLRSFAYLLCWRMCLSAQAADWDSFTSDLKAAKNLAKHLLEYPLLIEQITGLGIDG